MFIVMAGLPGTGKSTLARALAAALQGAVVDKDVVRAAMFGAFVDYTREQDDLAMESVYAAAVYLARKRPVFIDGRAFALRSQRARVLEAGGAGSVVIETVCSDPIAKARIDAACGAHLAGNRTFALYLDLQKKWEPIEGEKLVVDTGRDLAVCVEECLAYLRSRDTLSGTL